MYNLKYTLFVDSKFIKYENNISNYKVLNQKLLLLYLPKFQVEISDHQYFFSKKMEYWCLITQTCVTAANKQRIVIIELLCKHEKNIYAYILGCQT